MNPNSMTPVDWAKRPLQKYADFSGRAPRAEYWWFFLGIIIAYILLLFFVCFLGNGKKVVGMYGPLTALLWLATIVPSIAVGVRRLHDTNRSGWWMLLPFVPYAIALALAGPAIMAGGVGAGLGIAFLFMFVGMICAIVLLVLMCLGSNPGENRYGPNPYGEGETTSVAAE